MSSPLPRDLLTTIPDPLPTPTTLTHSTLSALLALYAPLLTHVSSTKSRKGWKTLEHLDGLRYSVLPARVQERHDAASAKDGKSKKGVKGAGEKWLEKEETEDLVAWKLCVLPALPISMARSRSRSAFRAVISTIYDLSTTYIYTES